jgi:hypothetical protein
LVKEKTSEVIEYFIDIRSNGGDPGTHEKNGRVYLNT